MRSTAAPFEESEIPSVLLCTADVEISNQILSGLERMNCNSVSVADDEDAIFLIELELLDSPRSILVLDSLLPDLGCYYLLSWVRRNGYSAEIRVVILIRRREELESWTSRPYQADRYLIMPIEASELLFR